MKKKLTMLFTFSTGKPANHIFHGVVFLFTLAVLLSGCDRNRDNYLSVKGDKSGYIPIYSDTFRSLTDTIKSLPPKPIINSGKIYIYKHLFFINEQEQGIHVFDNSNPSSPVPLCFIEIPGNFDISCKDSILYAESIFGLVHFNISGLPAIKDVRFMDTAFSKYTKGIYYLPPFYTYQKYYFFEGSSNYDRKVYFECIDPSKGYVVGWKYGTIKDPKCHKSFKNYYYE
jgi:hypothetical protein